MRRMLHATDTAAAVCDTWDTSPDFLRRWMDKDHVAGGTDIAVAVCSIFLGTSPVFLRVLTWILRRDYSEIQCGRHGTTCVYPRVS